MSTALQRICGIRLLGVCVSLLFLSRCDSERRSRENSFANKIHNVGKHEHERLRLELEVPDHYRIVAFWFLGDLGDFVTPLLDWPDEQSDLPGDVCRPLSERVPHRHSDFASVCWRDFFHMSGYSDGSRRCRGGLRRCKHVSLLEIVLNKLLATLMAKIVT